jgi:hypothetical protein
MTEDSYIMSIIDRIYNDDDGQTEGCLSMEDERNLARAYMRLLGVADVQARRIEGARAALGMEDAS